MLTNLCLPIGTLNALVIFGMIFACKYWHKSCNKFVVKSWYKTCMDIWE